MSVEIVVHRGIKNILYDNSIMGILVAIFRNKFCEFDIVWIHGGWKLCHDSHSISMYHSNLSDLLSLLKQYKHLVKHNIIIDIKWDFVWNQLDCLPEAMVQLRQALVGFEDYPFWLQVSHPLVWDALVAHCGTKTWKLGMLLYTMSDFHTYQQHIHYIMVSLSDFSLEEIITMSKQCLVFGYTCHNTSELSKYKHLFRYLKGIVCDVSL